VSFESVDHAAALAPPIIRSQERPQFYRRRCVCSQPSGGVSILVGNVGTQLPVRQCARSLDDLVRPEEHRLRDRETQRLSLELNSSTPAAGFAGSQALGSSAVSKQAVTPQRPHYSHAIPRRRGHPLGPSGSRRTSTPRLK